MPSSLDARHALLPTGRPLARVDLRRDPLPHAPSRPGRLEARPDGALLHVPADSSYMAGTRHEPTVHNGRVAVEGRCLDASGALGVVARLRSSGAGRSGYALLAQPGRRSFVLIDFCISPPENHFRVLHAWKRSDAVHGPGWSNRVELRHVGPTLQAVINGVLVATVVDHRYEKGTSGWVVRSYGSPADVLLSAIEVDEVSADERDAGPWSAAPHAVRLHPGRAAIREPWMRPPHAARQPVAHAAPPAAAHLAPPVDDPLLGVASRLAAAAEVAAMARHDDVWTRLAAARHPACSAVLLTRLASDVEWVVRLVVASRSDCPAIALDRLGSDERALVRHAVALNPVCPVELLERLALDRTRDIDHTVSRHPRCPPALRERLERRWGQQRPRPVAAPDWRVHEVPWNITPPPAP